MADQNDAKPGYIPGSVENDYDTTEKVERTDRGYRLTIESTRGTGTRDQDKVKAEARTETLGELKRERESVLDTVTDTLYKLRTVQPDDEPTIIRFAGSHGEGLEFIDVEDADGESVTLGEWVDDGEYQLLRFGGE